VGFAESHLIPLVDEGLGNSAYLLDLGDGYALAVDVSRDLRAVHETAARRGLRVRYAADTHLHADFLSGAVQLGRDAGATVLAAAAGRRGFPHRGLADGPTTPTPPGARTRSAPIASGATSATPSGPLSPVSSPTPST
jgi:hydroxyacylglutathione hydrolase